MAAIPKSISGGFAASMLIAVAIWGCASPNPYVGSWHGDREATFAPDTDPSISGTLNRIDLTVQPDGKFELTLGGLPMSGHVSPQSDQALLRVERVINQIPDGEPPQFPIRRNGPDLEIDLRGGPVKLIRRTDIPKDSATSSN